MQNTTVPLNGSKTKTKYLSLNISLYKRRSLHTPSRALERKFSRGYEGRYRVLKFYCPPPQALSGPMLLNHFLLDGCRSSFKSEGKTIFAHS